MAVCDPEILGLFESWFDELEEEAMRYLARYPEADSFALAEDLGLSRSGAEFLLAKIRLQQNKEA